MKPPSPYEQLLPLPTPCFKMFLEGSLNDPHPHHLTSSILHCYPLPIHHPPPLKILIIHYNWRTILIFKSDTRFCSKFVASWRHKFFLERKNKCYMVGDTLHVFRCFFFIFAMCWTCNVLCCSLLYRQCFLGL